MMSPISRRAALTVGILGGAAACSPRPPRTSFESVASAGEEYFRHGVASGDPGPDSVVIWTRFHNDLLPPPVDGRAIEWEVAEDAEFKAVAASGFARTSPSADWTVKVLVEGLQPGRRYFYRFNRGGSYSAVGRTRTLPEGSVSEARFAIVSCSNYPFGYFNVYDQIARRDDFDAVLHLGDYIYEYGPDGYGGEVGARLGRPHDPAHEIVTLEDYRRRHAQYKADPASRAMHAAHPVIAIWDDHETTNNSWMGGAENHTPETEGDWAVRKRAALQAYYEWMPIREPEPGRLREAIFRSFSYGDLLTLAALETRLMARGEQLSFNDFGPSLRTPADVEKFRREVLWDKARDMLGEEQLAFLASVFRASVAKGQPWRLLANQIIMAETIAPDLSPHVDEAEIQELEKSWDQARAFVEVSKLGLPTNLDAWDGYPAARERLYDMIKREGRDGLIVVTGDTHTWWANDLKAADGTKMGVELGVHSVTSPSPYRKSFLGGRGERYALLTNQQNRAVRYLNGEEHGYIDLLIRRDGAEAKFMAVDNIETPVYSAFEKAAFAIKRGGGAAKFAGARHISLKEQWLFNRT
ncbi:MAG: alkaline phosphatase D family protein [Parvularculaceae bacterium]|nr:alkaline phosphatase D family protein [Parvularculaceae bacterium]